MEYSHLLDVHVTISHSFFPLIGRESSIVQISAVCEDQKFNKYFTPSQEISEEASRLTGIKFVASTNELLHNNVAVSQSSTTSSFGLYSICYSTRKKLCIIISCSQ